MTGVTKIRRRQTSCTVAFSLLDARYIPVPGQHVHIVGRVVRLALFDKKSILSNIHSVPAVHNSDVDHIWKFSTKVCCQSTGAEHESVRSMMLDSLPGFAVIS